MLRIKEVIKEKGLTVKEVAEKLGMSSPSLSDAINGNPTADKLERIANALEVPITELFEQPRLNVINCPYCGKEIKVVKNIERFECQGMLDGLSGNPYESCLQAFLDGVQGKSGAKYGIPDSDVDSTEKKE